MKRTSLGKDCMYSDIMDWEQDAKTGKTTAIYWCEKNKKKFVILICVITMCHVILMIWRNKND